MPLKERILVVENLFIAYPFLTWCLKKIEECQQFSKLSAEPQCLLITGETGVGKSTLSKKHEAKYPRLDLEGGTIVPVLRTTIPIPSTPKTLVTALLDDLGDPIATTGSTHVQTLRLEGLLVTCKTELIILDEFQHFIDRDSEKVLAEISDWLKNLIDKWKKPVILMGLQQSIKVLEANSQLKRRFAMRIELTDFPNSGIQEKQSPPGIRADEKNFRTFLKTLDDELPLAKDSNLADASLAKNIYDATKGNIAHTMKLVRRATWIALRKHNEMLDRALLATAFNDLSTKTVGSITNPFIQE
jgi:hypothetical protein